MLVQYQIMQYYVTTIFTKFKGCLTIAHYQLHLHLVYVWTPLPVAAPGGCLGFLETSQAWSKSRIVCITLEDQCHLLTQLKYTAA